MPSTTKCCLNGNRCKQTWNNHKKFYGATDDERDAARRAELDIDPRTPLRKRDADGGSDFLDTYLRLDRPGDEGMTRSAVEGRVEEACRCYQEGEQDTKSHAGIRTVPLAGRLRSELVRHKLASQYDGRDDLCFGRSGAEAFSRATFRDRALKAWGWKTVPNPKPGARPKLLWVKAREDALEPLSPHEARHSCASYLAVAGLDVKEAQEAMGHAGIRTTMNIYTHALPGWQTAAASKLDTFLGHGVRESRAKVGA